MIEAASMNYKLSYAEGGITIKVQESHLTANSTEKYSSLLIMLMTVLVFSSYRPKKINKEKKMLPKQDCDHNNRHTMAIANNHKE